MSSKRGHRDPTGLGTVGLGTAGRTNITSFSLDQSGPSMTIDNLAIGVVLTGK